LYSNILPIAWYNCTVIYCENRYKTHKNAKFTNGEPFIFTFRERGDSHCCTLPQKLFRERPFVKHSFTVVYGVNCPQRHKNKRGPSVENRLSPGMELLFPFYFETNYVAEPEQKKNKLRKVEEEARRIKRHVCFFILQNIKYVFICPSCCMDIFPARRRTYVVLLTVCFFGD